ncbi:hypothetical protein Rsub_09355 [Raphidocelis subcapitata]|uniref:Sulfotransferase n=1 Tax=Raphidocelis subcapitata TaxID=307507 RepID=A0A2V0PAR0_9CHLO|nr:hypothetical protein Rsub_09355 [Raphidocelis subcapitata]|eukprot:GBF96609.1 hypothetical protein Rsub_09355 [Raphidocelis subcapitata]
MADAGRGRTQAVAALLVVLAAGVLVLLARAGPGALSAALFASARPLEHGSLRRHGGPAPLSRHGLSLSARLFVLSKCKTFACLRTVNALPAGGAKFNFPHAMIIGFPKCATTSLWNYLVLHPQGIRSRPKEPHYFTRCRNESFFPLPEGSKRWACNSTEDYYVRMHLSLAVAVKTRLQRAVIEGSTGYAGGHNGASVASIAADIRRAMPWVKLIVAMREPISQMISLMVHHAEQLSRPPEQRDYWMVETWEDLCLEAYIRGNATMVECVRGALQTRPSYADGFSMWLGVGWPWEQVHPVQYEKLVAPDTGRRTLDDVQRFLGFDPKLGAEWLPRNNSRRDMVNPNGWPMRRKDMEELIELVRPNADRIAWELQRRGYVTTMDDWLQPWREAWDRNLATCSPKGDCKYVLT